MSNFEVQWILDKDYLEICYDSVDNEMTQSLTRLGISFQVVQWRNRIFTDGFTHQNDNTVYGVVGSVAFCRNIGTILSAKVDMQSVFTFFPEEVKHFSKYAPMVKPEHKVNQLGFMLPLGEMRNQGAAALRSSLRYPEGVFLKCDFGLKSAESEFVLWDDLTSWMDYTLNHTGCSANSNFWLFPSREITKEFRLAIVNGEIITACQYMDFTDKPDTFTPTLSKDVPDGVLEAASTIIKYLSITDNTYIIDIADTPQGYLMIECNAISSSGWYCLDHERLMKILSAKVLDLAEEFLDDVIV